MHGKLRHGKLGEVNTCYIVKKQYRGNTKKNVKLRDTVNRGLVNWGITVPTFKDAPRIYTIHLSIIIIYRIETKTMRKTKVYLPKLSYCNIKLFLEKVPLNWQFSGGVFHYYHLRLPL